MPVALIFIPVFLPAGDAERTDHDREFAEALDSFVLLLDNDGTVVYVSNNISKHLGIPAVSFFYLNIQIFMSC